MEFKKKKVDVLNGVEAVFTEQPRGGEEPFPIFQVVASRAGIRLVGNSCLITSMAELDGFARVISEAWKEHKRLMPQLDKPSAQEVQQLGGSS